MVPFGTNSTIIVSVKVSGLEAKMNYKALGLTLEMSLFLRQEMSLTVLLYGIVYTGAVNLWTMLRYSDITFEVVRRLK